VIVLLRRRDDRLGISQNSERGVGTVFVRQAQPEWCSAVCRREAEETDDASSRPILSGMSVVLS
jgi:hypothetical protein